MRNVYKNPFIRIGLAATLALGLAACKANSDPKPEKTQEFYATWLAQNLAEGICKNLVAIWGEGDRQNAQSYVGDNGQPTPACPNPETEIAVICDPSIVTGDKLADKFVIRYGFSAGPDPNCKNGYVTI